MFAAKAREEKVKAVSKVKRRVRDSCFISLDFGSSEGCFIKKNEVDCEVLIVESVENF